MGAHVGVEVTLNPDDLRGSMAVAAAILGDESGGASAPASSAIEVRYHFPLGRYEIADPNPAHAYRALEHIARAVSAIAEQGGQVFTVHAALPSDVRGTNHFWATCARLREAVEIGVAHGVSVCVENLKWGATSEPRTFEELVEATGAAVTFDVGHANSSATAEAGFGADRFIRLIRPRILGAHVYERETDVHVAPETLNGMTSALDALQETPCDWWTIELTRPVEVLHTAALLTAYLDEMPENVSRVPPRVSRQSGRLS